MGGGLGPVADGRLRHPLEQGQPRNIQWREAGQLVGCSHPGKAGQDSGQLPWAWIRPAFLHAPQPPSTASLLVEAQEETSRAEIKAALQNLPTGSQEAPVKGDDGVGKGMDHERSGLSAGAGLSVGVGLSGWGRRILTLRSLHCPRLLKMDVGVGEPSTWAHCLSLGQD